MNSITLKANKALNTTLAKTNMVYVHPKVFSQIAGEKKIVTIKGFHFVIDQNEGVIDGEISLGGEHRTLLRAALMDPLSIKPLQISPQTIYATRVVIELSLLKVGKDKRNLPAPELYEEWKNSMNHLPLNNGLKYFFKFKDDFYYALIVELIGATSKDISDGKDSQPVISALYHNSLTVLKFRKGVEQPIVIEDDSEGRGASIFKPDWNFEKMGIGGLDDEFVTLFRRAFASRIFPTSVIKQMGINHVKGILLYGPPGTGKTLMARQIGQMLNTVEPKVINGPEVLSKYVGESEKNIRELFEPAEQDQEKNGDDAQLHLIIFDEIDSLCKKRGSTRDNTGVSDSVVNQLLSKIDGVNSLNNVLLIGMTNRRDLMDEALLRPGRLEVQIEVNLPDEKGRKQIFKIHLSRLIESGRLANDVSIDELAIESANYTGAEIAGVVKSAASYAMNERIKIDNLKEAVDVNDLKVTKNHLKLALQEVRPAFGVQEDVLDKLCPRGLINFSELFKSTREHMERFLDQLKNDPRSSLMSFCISGPPGAGLTAFSASIAKYAGFGFVRVIQAKQFIGRSEDGSCSDILAIFEDAYKSDFSAIIIDDIDMLVEFSPIGPRYSNKILQSLLVLLKTPPPKGRKIAIFSITNQRENMNLIGLDSRFFYEEIYLTSLSTINELLEVFKNVSNTSLEFKEGEIEKANEFIQQHPIPIKRAIESIDFVAYQSKDQPINWEELKFNIQQHLK